MAKEISRDFPESKSNVVNAVNKTMVSFELTIPPPPLNPKISNGQQLQSSKSDRWECILQVEAHFINMD